MANEDSIKRAILVSASENSSLLVRLSSTSEAPGLLRAQTIHISKLRDALTQQDIELERLQEEIDASFKIHQKFRDSVTRRFLYRATHMRDTFQAKASKAEQEHLSSIETQIKAKERQALLQRNLEEATVNSNPLEAAAKEHEEVHTKIDNLYEKLFAGPTPGFPHEDEVEFAVNISRTENEATTTKILEARRAVRLLSIAQRSVKAGKNCLRIAQRLGQSSVFFYDDAFGNLRLGIERVANALLAIKSAEEHFSSLPEQQTAGKQVLIATLEAVKSSLEPPYSKQKLALVVISGDEALSEAEEKLKGLIEVVKQQERDALEEIKGTARRLEDSRQQLQQIRRGIFEEVAGFGEAAPAYHECCNRAESYGALPEEVTVDVLGMEDETQAVDNQVIFNGPKPLGYVNFPSLPQPGEEEIVSMDVSTKF